ncbi:hypothetical protein ACFPM0_14250 [Pseudonocardia sulfidoxydans]|uniref:hypothetical protein n=1 Tax=Pseudonocardia sulfidoxydans TaxID=54011 RepID=UPI00360F6B5E
MSRNGPRGGRCSDNAWSCGPFRPFPPPCPRPSFSDTSSAGLAPPDGAAGLRTLGDRGGG